MFETFTTNTDKTNHLYLDLLTVSDFSNDKPKFSWGQCQNDQNNEDGNSKRNPHYSEPNTELPTLLIDGMEVQQASQHNALTERPNYPKISKPEPIICR